MDAVVGSNKMAPVIAFWGPNISILGIKELDVYSVSSQYEVNFKIAITLIFNQGRFDEITRHI